MFTSKTGDINKAIKSRIASLIDLHVIKTESHERGNNMMAKVESVVLVVGTLLSLSVLSFADVSDSKVRGNCFYMFLFWCNLNFKFKAHSVNYYDS